MAVLAGAAVIFLLISSPLYAEKGINHHYLDESANNLKQLEQQLKHYTRKELTQHSVIYLKRDGVRLETQYYNGDLHTEVEARENGDLTFRVKIPF